MRILIAVLVAFGIGLLVGAVLAFAPAQSLVLALASAGVAGVLAVRRHRLGAPR